MAMIRHGMIRDNNGEWISMSVVERLYVETTTDEEMIFWIEGKMKMDESTFILSREFDNLEDAQDWLDKIMEV